MVEFFKVKADLCFIWWSSRGAEYETLFQGFNLGFCKVNVGYIDHSMPDVAFKFGTWW